jgi:hypothetical protein
MLIAPSPRARNSEVRITGLSDMTFKKGGPLSHVKEPSLLKALSIGLNIKLVTSYGDSSKKAEKLLI